MPEGTRAEPLTVLHVQNLPDRVKRAFCGACVSRDETIRDVVDALMRLYVERPDLVADQVALVKKEWRRRREREREGRKGFE